MGAFPPTQGPGGATPPRPPLSVVPGQGAQPGPPGGLPPPPPGPPPQSTPPPSAAGQGPNAQSPFAGLLSDLSPAMGPGWQSLDVCTRAYKVALRSPEFQKMPAVVAVLQSQLKTLSELVSNYTSGTSGVDNSGSSSTPSSSSIAAPDTPGADADSMPAAPDDGGDQ